MNIIRKGKEPTRHWPADAGADSESEDEVSEGRVSEEGIDWPVHSLIVSVPVSSSPKSAFLTSKRYPLD